MDADTRVDRERLTLVIGPINGVLSFVEPGLQAWPSRRGMSLSRRVNDRRGCRQIEPVVVFSRLTRITVIL
jgi:hypothetical protein